MNEGNRVNNQKLQNFIDLVTFDQNLINLESLIAKSKQTIVTLKQELESLEKKYDDKALKKKEIKKQLDLQELQVKELQEKEKHQVSVVEKAASSKQYDAASNELENLKINRDQQETKLMQLWNMHETIEKDLQVLQNSQIEKKSQIQTSITEEQESLQKLEHDLQEQNKKRQAIIDTVPSEWIELYEHMRGKVANPVVPVSQDSCSGCFYLISSKDLQFLREDQLVQCKDCYRFLYFDKEDQQDEAQ